MGLALDTDTELFSQLQESFSEEKACEHSMHTDTDPVRHYGSAEWYSMYSCLRCGDGGVVMAFCDRWKKFVDTGAKLWCDCGYVTEGQEFYRYGWTRIDGKGK